MAGLFSDVAQTRSRQGLCGRPPFFVSEGKRLDTLGRRNDNPPVFRKLGHVLLIVALVAAVGGHWAVLQSVAWTNMLAGNLRAASVTEAFEKTFDGQHPCRLCQAIKEGKKSEKKTELPMPLKKIDGEGCTSTITKRASNCSERLRAKCAQLPAPGMISCKLLIIWQPLHTPSAKVSWR